MILEFYYDLNCSPLATRDDYYLFGCSDTLTVLGCILSQDGIQHIEMTEQLLTKFKASLKLLRSNYNSKASVYTRAKAINTFSLSLWTYYFSFILLNVENANKLDKLIVQFVKPTPIANEYVFLHINEGGLGLCRLIIRNFATQAHWIIRAFHTRSTEQWSFLFMSIIFDNMNNNLNQISNCIVKNCLVAWYTLNLGPLTTDNMNGFLEIKDICLLTVIKFSCHTLVSVVLMTKTKVTLC